MFNVGIDIGSIATKAVVFDTDKKIPVAHAICPTGWDVKAAGKNVLTCVLQQAGIDQASAVFATGYGRISFPFATKRVTEITCHARGAYYLFPNTRLVLDIGGQDSKAIHLAENGSVDDFLMNDKCAAGTGRFLQMLLGILGMDFSQLEDAVGKGVPAEISSQCAVFAESEIVGLLASGRSPADVACGVLHSIAHRLQSLFARLPFHGECTFTGGLAQSRNFVKILEQELGIHVNIPQYPQYVGALGAAMLAI